MEPKSDTASVPNLQEIDLYDELVAFTSTLSVGGASAPEIFSEEEGFDLVLSLTEEVEAQSAPAPSFGQVRCPGCGSAASPEDLLCVACGSFLE